MASPCGASSQRAWIGLSYSEPSDMSLKTNPAYFLHGRKISNGDVRTFVQCRERRGRAYLSFARHSCVRGASLATLSNYGGRKNTPWLHFGFTGGTSVHRNRFSADAQAGIRSGFWEIDEDGVWSPVSPNMEDSSKIVTHRATDERGWQDAVAAAGRVIVLCCASACVAWFLSYARVVHAASDRRVLTTLGEQGVTLKGVIWPQMLRVLSVFKEQGLLLSALLGLSAFFSMAETSIMTLWPWKVRELAEKEGEGGVFRRLRQDVTRFLTTILIGTTVVNIAATALVTDAATSLFGEAGVTAATGVMTVVILLVTEIAPKSIAVHNATEVARFAVRPVAWLSVILYPVGRVVTALSMALLKCLGLKSSGEPFVSEEELKLMLRGAELSGAIEEEEQDMIENVLEIKDTYVREVMTPLVDVVAIDAESTLMEFRNYWVKHQYSRTPIFERRVDNIVGIAYAMDMLDYVDYDTEQVEAFKKLTVGHIAHRPAYFVPDSMSVWNLLREFRIRKVHMAIVLNEYGGTVGLVTLEDVVEEIVGEIFDENDSKEEIRKKTGYVVQRAHGVFDVDANTHIEDLSEALEVKMPEGPYRYETVSGFVCEAFGHIPRTGDSINVILKKADVVDGQDGHDGETHHQEDHNEQYHKFRVEILAGNARKVGAVRFELVQSQNQKAEVVFPQSTRVFSKGWAEPAKSSDICEHISDVEDDYCEAEPMADEECCESQPSLNSYPLKNSFFSSESGKVEGDTAEAPATRNGHLATSLEELEMPTTDPGTKSRGIENNAELSLLSHRWIEQEKQEERSMQGRRRQPAEAAVNQERQRRIDVRRREVDLAMAAIKQERDEQVESGSFQK